MGCTSFWVPGLFTVYVVINLKINVMLIMAACPFIVNKQSLKALKCLVK